MILWRKDTQKNYKSVILQRLFASGLGNNIYFPIKKQTL